MTKEHIYQKVLDHLEDGVYFVDQERTITFWNKAAEKITGFSASEVLGRHCSHNLLNHVDEEGELLCVALCPLGATLRDGAEREDRIYIQHKEGHRVPVDVRIIPVTDDQGIITGAVEIFREPMTQAYQLIRYNDEEANRGSESFFTQWTPYYCERVLKARLEEVQRIGGACGLLFIEIDHLAAIRSTLGEDIGNQVLKMVATSVLNSLKPFDFLIRWERAGFAAICMNATPEELKRVSNRVRMLIERSSLFRASHSIRVTASIGATLVRPGDSFDAVLKRTNDLLARSKRLGRNRVTLDLTSKDSAMRPRI